MAKFTVVEIKKILTRAGDRSGFIFSKKNPYYANAGRLRAMRDKFEEMIERYEDQISKRQQDSIAAWFIGFEDLYEI